MPDEAKPPVLIVGPRINYLTRPLPRLFARAGARVVFASPPGCSVRSSRYVHERLDFDSSLPEAAARLEEMMARVEPALLVVVEEPFVEALLRLPPERIPRVRRHLQLPPALGSRAAFHLWAESDGLAVPEGGLCHGADDVKRAVERWGAVFLKRDGSSGGSGVRKVESVEQADAVWRELGDPAGVLVQRALGGVVGITDMIVCHGRLQAWVSSEKWRTAKPNGPSVARRLCLPDGMAELVERTAVLTNFHGLCGFDWVIDSADGRPRLIEFHPRPPSGFGLGRWAGVAFDEVVAALVGLAGERLQSPDPAAFARKPVCCYFPDHPLACLRRRDWRELRRWLPGSDSRSWSMVPWDDPALLWRMVANALGR
jgi:hypothetical protein